MDRVPYYKLDNNYEELRMEMTKVLMKGSKPPNKNTFRKVSKMIDTLLKDLVYFISDLFLKEEWDVSKDKYALSKFLKQFDIDVAETTRNTVKSYGGSISHYLKTVVDILPYNRTYKFCDEFRDAFTPILVEKIADFDFTIDLQVRTIERVLLDKEMLYKEEESG